MTLPLCISFGSNINPEHNLFHGLARLHALTRLTGISTVYQTKAIPDPDQPSTSASGGGDPDFLNGVVLLQEAWDPFELQRCLKQIEIDLGRVPTQPRWAARTLDLDIVLMGDCVLHHHGLIVPDPDILTRAFLAVSLAELVPECVHPVEKVSLAAIADRFGSHALDWRPDPVSTSRLRKILA
ncbi:MAG: 2-amino-4-hydroxy-6-hydroxymethyldihydropteridine diphosphokinase [Magnetococcus sp. YQC-5]